MYAVDIPNPQDLNAEWVEVGEFATREEAIEYAKKRFGADEEGRIALVTGPHT